MDKQDQYDSKAVFEGVARCLGGPMLSLYIAFRKCHPRASSLPEISCPGCQSHAARRRSGNRLGVDELGWSTVVIEPGFPL
jgi:hypothetical protein